MPKLPPPQGNQTMEQPAKSIKSAHELAFAIHSTGKDGYEILPSVLGDQLEGLIPILSGFGHINSLICQHFELINEALAIPDLGLEQSQSDLFQLGLPCPAAICLQSKKQEG